MTKAEIITRASQDLEDSGLIHFNAKDFLDSFHDGYQMVSLLTQCIEKSETLSLTVGKSCYNFSELISDYYRAFAIYDLTNKRWLTPVGFLAIKDTSVRWATIQGNPNAWSLVGQSHILFHPTPNATISILVFYKAVAKEILYSEVPVIPIENHIVLQYYMVGDLLEQNLEYTKAALNMSKFATELASIKTKVDKRDWPDRIFVLTGHAG